MQVDTDRSGEDRRGERSFGPRVDQSRNAGSLLPIEQANRHDGAERTLAIQCLGEFVGWVLDVPKQPTRRHLAEADELRFVLAWHPHDRNVRYVTGVELQHQLIEGLTHFDDDAVLHGYPLTPNLFSKLSRVNRVGTTR